MKGCNLSKDCSNLDKENCLFEPENSNYCKYNKITKECSEIDCNIKGINDATIKLALATCKMTNDGMSDDSDITGRFG